MNQLVSVIIPTYKQSNFLKKALDSVINQTYKNLEIIVIDNNLDDENVKIIKQYLDKRIILFKINNSGNIAKSRNLGIKKSSGELIAFLDSDDFWNKKKIEVSLKYLEKNKADISYHPLYGYSNNIKYCKIIEDKNINISKNVFQNLIIKGNFIAQSSVIVKKKILQRINYISELKDKITWEDFDTWVRISKITDKFIFIPSVLGYCNLREGTMSSLKQSVKNSTNFKKFYKNDILDICKNNTTWWLEYPLVLNYFKDRKYLFSYLKTKTIKFCPMKFYYRIMIIKYYSFFLLILKKLYLVFLKFKKIFNTIYIFKVKNLRSKISNDVKLNFYKINNADDLKKRNIKLNFNEFNRLNNKNTLLIINNNNDEVVCKGWMNYNINSPFFIEELDKYVFFKNSYVLYDFETKKKYRNKGFYKILLKLILNEYADNELIIYANPNNKFSISAIKKAGFSFMKKLYYFNV